MSRVVITGMGIVSPIGNDLDSVKNSLMEGRSGIQAMPQWKKYEGLKSLVTGKVDGIEGRDIPRSYRRTMGRVALLNAFAARQATELAELEPVSLDSDRIGVAMGSTMGSATSLDKFFKDFRETGGFSRLQGTMFMKVMSHTVSANTAAMLGVKGQLHAPCSACASSTQAIGLGYEIIRSGAQDIMICGGSDELHPTVVGVFDVLNAASRRYNDKPEMTPRPFDIDRDGLVLSEGAAVVVLENYEHAIERKARIYGEILGYATYCDVLHMTQPSSDGMLRCMRQALLTAGCNPTDLHYINAHATGTLMGDEAEAKALRELVGQRVPVSGTKGYTGHTLGGCGAMEVIFCLLMMRDGFILPTLNLSKVDPKCAGIAHVKQLTRCKPRIVMSSNFAFGGINASIVLGKGPDRN
jgi:3-oxoacyl-[acyl-carrier-protein] synthase II